ncbi:Hypothetical predicted protein [Mytilus galloprovincialis]|uniref:B box-type domain-containing protein n=1 Tax=Mytilus galloprovincialis TaxID=29158 RepID=A0A8B6C224_MYTGA|nr:Hypothetical predicted protein [Mytilus galloprovincialis]
MATNEIALFCDVCQNRDLNKSAEEYCPQCEEFLCTECSEHHKLSKLLKSHQTITVDKYNKLPSFIKQMSQNCEEHDSFLEVYCKSHDSLCCKRCLISSHKECKETIFVEDFLALSSRHQSAALDNVEKVLKDLDDNICFAIKDRNRNLTELREQKRVIAEQIKEKRQQIKTFLNNLEEAITEKLSATEKEYCLEIEKVIEKLNERKKKVDEIKNDVESMKQFASNLQIFMGTKKFEENVSTTELNVQSLFDNASLDNITMVCTLNENLNRLINDIKTFGDIEVNKYEKHASFSWKGNKSAQFFKPMPGDKSIEYINVRLVRKIEIDRNDLSGCGMSETGKLLFLQAHKNTLLIYEADGEFNSKMHIKPVPSKIGYDLAVVDSNTVAVSSGGNCPYAIYFIDTNTTEMQQVFDLNDFCYGLSYHNGSFVVCTDIKGIQIFDRSHENATNFRLLPNSPQQVSYTYVTSNENFIFHSNCYDHSVVCYDFNGQVQWIYSDSLLRKPCGITLDSHSNIYVVGFDSNNIVVISPNGKQAKELIGACDGLSNPRAIHFDKTKSLLLVANYNEAAFLFRV